MEIDIHPRFAPEEHFSANCYSVTDNAEGFDEDIDQLGDRAADLLPKAGLGWRGYHSYYYTASAQFCLPSEAVKWASDPASAVISRDQSLKPAIVTLIVCYPTLSFNVEGALPTNESSA